MSKIKIEKPDPLDIGVLYSDGEAWDARVSRLVERTWQRAIQDFGSEPKPKDRETNSGKTQKTRTLTKKPTVS